MTQLSRVFPRFAESVDHLALDIDDRHRCASQAGDEKLAAVGRYLVDATVARFPQTILKVERLKPKRRFTWLRKKSNH
jgi:hypothetical protein